MMKPDLSIQIGSLKLKNPVMVASGTFGYGKEAERFTDVRKLGAIVAKTVTLKPRVGNPPPRIAEVTAGMLNAIGLQNDGVDRFIEEKIPYLKKLGIPVVVSISGGNKEEWRELAKKFDRIKEVSAIELNLSCPNIHYSPLPQRGRGLGEGGDGLEWAQDSWLTALAVKSVRLETKKLVIAKLSPEVVDIKPIAKAAVEAGADAISVMNTIRGIAIDIEKRKPVLSNITGGLSGPAIKPIALRLVWQVAQAVKVPVIGIGGIMNWKDALEFMMAGATAIQVGTANYINPRVTVEIIEGIDQYLKEQEIQNIRQLIGAARR
ncbi:MAG: dihydroorotate dehydrogenase [Candidatus Omnitrophica bacterium]|nr:dihydroorotate dehydrogenase [Candidatus Omnitrophota bacterium]